MAVVRLGTWREGEGRDWSGNVERGVLRSIIIRVIPCSVEQHYAYGYILRVHTGLKGARGWHIKQKCQGTDVNWDDPEGIARVGGKPCG